MVRVISDVGMLQDVTVTALLPLVARMLILAGMVGVMFWMNWQLALLALALLPLFWLRTVKLSRDIRKAAKQQRRREGAMAATAAESFSGRKVVQALAAADAFTDAFSSLWLQGALPSFVIDHFERLAGFASRSAAARRKPPCQREQ